MKIIIVEGLDKVGKTSFIKKYLRKYILIKPKNDEKQKETMRSTLIEKDYYQARTISENYNLEILYKILFLKEKKIERDLVIDRWIGTMFAYNPIIDLERIKNKFLKPLKDHGLKPVWVFMTIGEPLAPLTDAVEEYVWTHKAEIESRYFSFLDFVKSNKFGETLIIENERK